jgi:hypothetical protein
MSAKKNIFEPSLSEKIASWVGKRYAVILTGASLAVACSAIALVAVEQQKTEQVKAWQKIAMDMSGKVVVATVDGRVALVEKQPLQPEIARAIVNAFVRDYFVFDIQHLFGDLNNRPTNFKQFLKNSPLVKKWLEAKVLTKTTLPQFRSLLQYYYGLLTSEKFLSIPYSLYYKSAENEDFKMDKTGKWIYKADWDVEITYIKPNTNNDLGIAKAQTHIELVGKFEPFHGNALNPLGIKIISIKFKPITAPSL